MLNDIANSSGNPYESIQWPSVVMITSPLVSIFVVKLYKWNNQDASKGKDAVKLKREDDMELTDVAPTKMTAEETNNPIHP